MTDRELLELAAKAAGIEQGADRTDCGISITLSDGRHGYLPQWNPLTDDGDALRLAVAIGVSVYTARPGSKDSTVTVEWVSPVKGADGVWVDEPLGSDWNHDTRRAIVRAAAEIGKTLGE